jgi:hypothetical protein
LKTYIGNDGHYEIDDSGSVIQKMVDQFGKLTGKIRKYSNPKYITDAFDRDRILNMLQMLRIYRNSGRC